MIIIVINLPFVGIPFVEIMITAIEDKFIRTVRKIHVEQRSIGPRRIQHSFGYGPTMVLTPFKNDTHVLNLQHVVIDIDHGGEKRIRLIFGLHVSHRDIYKFI